MGQDWPSQNLYGYYPHDPNGSSERHATSPPNSGETNATDDPAHRRVHDTQRSHSSFPPPPTPPPHVSSSHTSRNVNTPPFLQTFYSSHYSPPSGTGAGSGLALHHMPQTMGYGGHVPISAPRQPSRYPVTSPFVMSTPSLNGNCSAPAPHSYRDSPRLPGGYLSSPGVHHLSPTFPGTHLILPSINASTGCTSSSSYSGVSKTLVLLSKNKRGGTSATQSDSWDEGEGEFTTGTSGWTGSKTETDDQPWGRPQEEFKALNPRDKKQVRNRIGARRFRAKRKEYVNNLEKSLRAKEEECTALRNQVDAQRDEIDDLRQRLSLPLMPPPNTALGLVVPNSEWHEGIPSNDRKVWRRQRN